MKQTYQDFELQGADPTGAIVSASFAAPLPAANARHEITIAVNHYNGFSNDRPPELYPDATDGIAVAVQGGNDVDLRVTTSPASASAAAPPAPAAPRNPNTTPVTGLERLVREPTGGPLFIATGLVIAVLLGALHALTPGHGKTLMAAYLVGSRGTPMRACALGGVITLTHTGSVIVLGIATVLLAGTVVPERIIVWTELVSGLAIVALGVALLRARLRSAKMAIGIVRRRTAHQNLALAGPPSAGVSTSEIPSPLLHEHEDGTVHAHGWFGEHGHTHALPQETSWKSLLLMGMGGGIIPCPDALAILLVAMAAGHILLGITIVLGFSVGLAAVLIALGLLLTTTRLLDRATNRWRWLDRAGPWLPVLSAVVIIVLGLVAFARAVPALR
jgi:nickel/cobalt exporter